MNMNECLTVATKFRFRGSFNGLCNYAIIYNHIILQFNPYYDCMRVVVLLYVMHTMMVHNTYKGHYFSHGAESEMVRNCALDYKNELAKAPTSSESKENCELIDDEAITTGVVIYYSNSQKFGSQKNEYHEAISSLVCAQKHCFSNVFFVCNVCQCKICSGSNDCQNNVI